jgi:hypothetical protein
MGRKGREERRAGAVEEQEERRRKRGDRILWRLWRSREMLSEMVSSKGRKRVRCKEHKNFPGRRVTEREREKRRVRVASRGEGHCCASRTAATQVVCDPTLSVACLKTAPSLRCRAKKEQGVVIDSPSALDPRAEFGWRERDVKGRPLRAINFDLAKFVNRACERRSVTLCVWSRARETAKLQHPHAG